MHTYVSHTPAIQVWTIGGVSWTRESSRKLIVCCCEKKEASFAPLFVARLRVAHVRPPLTRTRRQMKLTIKTLKQTSFTIDAEPSNTVRR